MATMAKPSQQPCTESCVGSGDALAGNVRLMLKLHRAVERYWHKMLSTRSWAGSCTWAVFNQLKERFPLQRPKIYLSYGRLQTYAVL
jgi:RNA-directed DNA polymerase